MSGRRARRCEVAKRAARVRLVVRLHTICPFVNVLVTYSLDYSIPPPNLPSDFDKCASQIGNCPTLAPTSSGAGPSPECLAASSTSPKVPAPREPTLAEAIRHITPQRAPKGNSRVTSEIHLPRPLLDAPPAARPRRRFARRPQSARTARANSRRDNSAYHASARSERQLSRGPRIPLAAPSGQLGTIDMNVSTCIGWDSPWKPPRKR